MVDLDKIIAASHDDVIQKIVAEGGKDTDRDEEMFRLMFAYCSALLKNYHASLRAELRSQGIEL